MVQASFFVTLFLYFYGGGRTLSRERNEHLRGGGTQGGAAVRFGSYSYRACIFLYVHARGGTRRRIRECFCFLLLVDMRGLARMDLLPVSGYHAMWRASSELIGRFWPYFPSYFSVSCKR